MTDNAQNHRDNDRHFQLQIISEDNDATETHSLEDYARNIVLSAFERTPNALIPVECVNEYLDSTETMNELPMTKTDDKSLMYDDDSNLSANGSVDDHKKHDA